MSLSGKLEIFPLEEVLRLLARSRQDGCLQVDGPGAGRIYMESGSMTYASVEADDAIRGHLIASGIADEAGLSRLDVSGGNLAEALAPGAAGSALADLVREQCIESIYRIRRPATGDFQFLVDRHPRYPTGQSFDVEAIISESERRATEWADIETVVPDLATPWRMVPEIDEESVNLSDTAWRFLAAMDGACAVDELAGRLGLTTFQTARRMAELSRARLVEPVQVSAPAQFGPEYSAPQPTVEPHAFGVSEQPSTEEQTPGQEGSWWFEDEPVAEEAASEEPSGLLEETPTADDTFLGEDVATEEPPSPDEESAGDEWAGEETGEETEDDDSFLETVFGELEKTEDTEETDDEDDSGFGLLRRRGLGAAFRELADG